jgi:hypothetical protein
VEGGGDSQATEKVCRGTKKGRAGAALRHGGTPSSEAHLGLFGGEKKSQNKNFDNHITTI